MIDMIWLQEAVGATSALAAAGRLGVLDRLAEGPTTVPELAERCRISVRGAQALATALAGMGLVVREGETWRAASPHVAGLGSVVADWDRLEQVARTGEPLRAAGEAAAASAYYPAHVARIAAHAGDAPARLAELLATPGLRVLDVGAGTAPWSAAILDRCDGTATLFDVPAVLAVAQDEIARRGLAARVAFLAGDLLRDPWGGPFDLVLLANVLHLFDPEAAAAVVARAARVLAPGGRVVVVEPLLDDDLAGPRAVALYATGLLLRTAGGGPCTAAGVTAWLRDADLVAEPPIPLGPMATALPGRAAAGRGRAGAGSPSAKPGV